MTDDGLNSAHLRVVVVGLNYAPEPVGIGPYTTGLAEYLARRGHEVTAVVGRPYYPQWRVPPAFRRPLWRRSREQGVTVIRCPHYVPRGPTGLRRIVHHLSFACAVFLPALIYNRRRKPDAILCVVPSLLSALVALVAARLARTPLWLHIQDFEVEAAQATGLFTGQRSFRLLAAFERMILRQAHVVSTISPKMVEGVVAKGVPRSRAYELRNWAEPSRDLVDQGHYRQSWALEEKTVALYSGSLGRKHGLSIIADAARSLVARPDLVFVVCGEGPDLPGLKIAAAGLPNVRFQPLQPAERLAELLAMADMHLLPQITAAADLVLPSKLTNILQSGRPVIATAEPGTGLYNEVEGCGILVAPGDASALANAIVQLADDPAHARRLGQKAKQRAAERWSRSAILGAFERRLLQLVN